jgi:hypothetical protein
LLAAEAAAEDANYKREADSELATLYASDRKLGYCLSAG